MNGIYECQICHTQMILTSKPTKECLKENQGCYFYFCECGIKIVSEAFFNKDGTPQIFYDNLWRFNPKTKIWSYWRKGYGNWKPINNAYLAKEYPIPKTMRFVFR